VLQPVLRESALNLIGNYVALKKSGATNEVVNIDTSKDDVFMLALKWYWPLRFGSYWALSLNP